MRGEEGRRPPYDRVRGVQGLAAHQVHPGQGRRQEEPAGHLYVQGLPAQDCGAEGSCCKGTQPPFIYVPAPVLQSLHGKVSHCWTRSSARAVLEDAW